MKLFLKTLLFVTCISYSVSAQKKHLFDPSIISDSVKIMSVSFNPDAKSNFYLSEQNTIKEFADNVFLGDSIKAPIIDSYWTIIKLIKNKETILSWFYCPSGPNIQYQNHCYDFDFTQLKQYMLTYNTKYTKFEKNFVTMADYNTFLDTIKTDKDIINFEPTFSYFEGWFYITIPFTNEINDVSKAIHKVENELSQLNENAEFRVCYPGDLFNIQNQKKLCRLMIESSFTQFSRFNPIDEIKYEWNSYPNKVKLVYYKLLK